MLLNSDLSDKEVQTKPFAINKKQQQNVSLTIKLMEKTDLNSKYLFNSINKQTKSIDHLLTASAN